MVEIRAEFLLFYFACGREIFFSSFCFSPFHLLVVLKKYLSYVAHENGKVSQFFIKVFLFIFLLLPFIDRFKKDPLTWRGRTRAM